MKEVGSEKATDIKRDTDAKPKRVGLANSRTQRDPRTIRVPEGMRDQRSNCSLMDRRKQDGQVHRLKPTRADAEMDIRTFMPGQAMIPIVKALENHLYGYTSL